MSMTCNAKRVAQSCHFFMFAIRPSAGANLAYATATDLAITPATPNFNSQVGSTLPAAPSLQIENNRVSILTPPPL